MSPIAEAVANLLTRVGSSGVVVAPVLVPVLVGTKIRVLSLVTLARGEEGLWRREELVVVVGGFIIIVVVLVVVVVAVVVVVVDVVTVVVVVVAVALYPALVFGMAGALTVFAVGQWVRQEVLVAEEVTLNCPQKGALLRVHIAFCLDSEPEISIIFKAGLVFILTYMAHHEGVVFEQSEVIPRVIMKVGLVENGPRSRPSVKRVDLSFSGPVVCPLNIIGALFYEEMGTIVTVRNINGLVLREEVSKVHELIVLNFFQLGFGDGRGG